jgi:GNAT superfamily N-acetyltransferase
MWDNLRNVRRSLQNVGFARTVQRAFQNALPSWFMDFNSLIATQSDFRDQNMDPSAEEWPYRWADKNDLELLTQGGLPADEVHAFFDQGAYGAMCAKDGKLIACTWYFPNPYITYDWICVVLDQVLYVAAAYVAPEYRGRRIQSQTRNFAYPALSDLGYTGVFSFTEHLNRSSIRARGNSVLHHIGRMSYARILGFVVYSLDGKWGAGLWNHKRPLELSVDYTDRENIRLTH